MANRLNIIENKWGGSPTYSTLSGGQPLGEHEQFLLVWAAHVPASVSSPLIHHQLAFDDRWVNHSTKARGTLQWNQILLAHGRGPETNTAHKALSYQRLHISQGKCRNPALKSLTTVGERRDRRTSLLALRQHFVFSQWEKISKSQALID